MCATAALGNGATLLGAIGEARHHALGNASRLGVSPIDILADESHDSAFLALNSNRKIPAI